jgi:hypothetical protein
MIPTTKNFFRAIKLSQFEYKKTTLRALKRAIKVDLLLIFCCYYTDRVTKTQRIRTKGLRFVDTSSGTDLTYAA